MNTAYCGDSRQRCHACPDLPGWEGAKTARQRCPAWAPSRFVEPGREGGFCFSDILVPCRGAKAVPHFVFLEKGPLDKCCECNKHCRQGSPCRTVPAEPGSQRQGGSKGSILHCTESPEGLSPPLAPLSPEQGWAPGLLLATIAALLPTSAHPCSSGGCLSVCLATAVGRPGAGMSPSSAWQLQTGLQQLHSALSSCGNGLLPLLFFSFAHLLRIVAATKIKTKYHVSV